MTTLADMTPQERAFMAKRMPRRYAQLRRTYDADVEAKQAREVVELALKEQKRRDAIDRWKPVNKREKVSFIRLNDIKRAYLRVTTVGWLAIVSPRRSQSIVKERHALMWLAKKHTSKSLPEIGRWLGGKDHSTVLHGIRKVESNLVNYSPLIVRIENQLKGYECQR